MMKSFTIDDGGKLRFVFNGPDEFYIEYETEEDIIRIDVTAREELELLRFLNKGG